jgi:hypothetical protein
LYCNPLEIQARFVSILCYPTMEAAFVHAAVFSVRRSC